MERRLGPTGLSRSAHGQASWGSGGNSLGKIFFGPFLYRNQLWVIRVLLLVVLPCFRVRENIVATSYILYSSLIIVKYPCNFMDVGKIVEPCKYCLVRVIVFL